MKATKTKVTKSQPAPSKVAKKRVRSLPAHRTLRLSKKKLKQPQSIPSAWQLLKDTTSILKNNKKLFFGIAILNAVIAFLFIRGLSSSFDLVDVKHNVTDLVEGQSGKLYTAVAVFGYLVTTASSSVSDKASVYQLVWTVVTTLAIIWAVRQIKSGEKPRIRDTYYKGMYPLIPFVLVVIVICVQLIPLLFGNLIYATILQNGIAVSVLEKFLWFLLFMVLALLSAYMLISSLFSLYIVTLPDMTPLRALRSARELVLHRRLAISLRIIALPLIVLLVGALIFIPLIIFAAPVVEIIFLLLTGIGLIFIHTYMYLLYRSLL
jgi:hypothetical protein